MEDILSRSRKHFVKNGLEKEKWCTNCKATTSVNEKSDGKEACSRCGKEYKN